MKNIEIINKLASGINPLNGESLPNDDLYNDPNIIRALFSAVQSMRGNNNPVSKDKQKENKRQGKPKNAGMPWTQESKDKLAEKYKNGSTVEDLSITFERTEGAMKAELVRQGLMDADEVNYPVRMEKIKTNTGNIAINKGVDMDDDDLPFS
jgi:hypothetical protein